MSRIRKSWWRRSAAIGALLVAAGFPVAGVQASTAQPKGPAVSTAPSAARGTVPARLWPAGLARPEAAQAGLSLTILEGVFCTSRSSCWAVGQQQAAAGTAVINQVLRWNGKSWRTFPVPNPAGTGSGAENELFAVRCLTATNCWAVGEYSKNDDASIATQALHWNGKHWSKVPTPNPAGTSKGGANELFDVTCVTSANCWSVGDFGTPVSGSGTQKLLNLTVHWNGKHWSRVRLANPGGTTATHVNELFSVRCGSASNCNTAGEYGTTPFFSGQTFTEIFHWNGKRWSKVKAPNPGGTGSGRYSIAGAIACGSALNCWDAGSYGGNSPTSTSRNEILHWTGKSWSRATTPNPPGTYDELIGATCASKRDCWAVGSQGNSPLSVRNETLHWNGKRWAVVFSPNPIGVASATLIAARCANSASCWAVGYKRVTSVRFRDEILHWNGKKWAIQSAPNS